MSEKQYIHEYGPYDIEEDGQPHFGQVVSDFLKKRGWTVEQFGILYGQLVKNSPYTRVRMHQMIRNNSFPLDKNRRYFIASLLHIPPILLGVISLNNLLETNEEKIAHFSTKYSKDISIIDYKKFLEACWSKNHKSTAKELLGTIQTKIQNIQSYVIYAKYEEKEKLYHLLCNYHILLAHIGRDQQQYQTSLFHLNRAEILATEKGYSTLQAAVLLQKGITNREKAANLSGEPQKRAINSAISCFSGAQDLVNSVDLQLKCAILLASGDAQAYLGYQMRDKDQINVALRKEQSIYKIAKKSFNDPEEHFIQFDEERLHLGIASTLIEINRPQDAIEHLDILGRIESGRRRQAYLNILYAQAYIKKGLYPIATTLALEALLIVKEIQSHVNVLRIIEIHKSLEESSFAHSIDVAVLGAELIKVQHPHLFN